MVNFYLRQPFRPLLLPAVFLFAFAGTPLSLADENKPSSQTSPVNNSSLKELKLALANAQKYSRTHSHQQTQGWWEEDSWMANERPYQEAKAKLFQEVTQVKGQEATTALSLVQSTGQEARAHRFNALAAFRYGYAVFLASQRGVTLQRGSISKGNFQDDLLNAERNLQELPAPHSYEVSRVLFLLRAKMQWSSQMTLLGERLLAHDPSDRAVKNGLVQFLLTGFLPPPEQKLALLCAQSLVQQGPSDPAWYMTLGSVYYRLWEHSGFHDAQNKAGAIQSYSKAATLLPKDNPNVVRIRQFVVKMQNKKAALSP